MPAGVVQAMRTFLGQNDMMAYLTMISHWAFLYIR